MNFRLRKNDRLSGRTAINTLFEQGQSLMAFPLRAVVRFSDSDTPCARMLVSVPKKRLRHAVDRVRVRRLVREAYRLARHRLLDEALANSHRSVDIAFVYLHTEVANHDTVTARVEALLQRVEGLLTTTPPQP